MRIINEWDLSRKMSIVITNSAANITTAIQSILKWKHFGCYAHSLNLILQDSLLIVNDIIKKVKTIVTFFKRSNSANLKLTKYQEQIGVQQPKKLLQDVVTPVSYTHLDVYKRQWLFPSLSRFFFLKEEKNGRVLLKNKNL